MKLDYSVDYDYNLRIFIKYNWQRILHNAMSHIYGAYHIKCLCIAISQFANALLHL